ncbi:MAG TPA: hypothetical protein VK673_21385 [Chthoniobacterales bacterium]|nr:hypothetical protein [Chthoniobacterales bacterium]
MRIYVAGVVPRDSLGEWLLIPLLQLYGELEQIAAERKIEVLIPRVNPDLESMHPEEFVKVLKDEIIKSDGVLTVFHPPTVAVGFEAHFASTVGKPQAIVLSKSWLPPRFLVALPCIIGIYVIEDQNLQQIVSNLLAAIQHRVCV